MQIKTKNNPQNISRKELREACKFMYAFLADRSMYARARVVVHSIYIDPKLYLDALIIPKKNSYDIYIDKSLSKDEKLLALAHELVHLKQFEYEELEESIGSMTLWKRKLYDEDKIEYSDLPWEKEAESKSYGLLKRWQNHKNMFTKF